MIKYVHIMEMMDGMTNVESPLLMHPSNIYFETMGYRLSLVCFYLSLSFRDNWRGGCIKYGIKCKSGATYEYTYQPLREGWVVSGVWTWGVASVSPHVSIRTSGSN